MRWHRAQLAEDFGLDDTTPQKPWRDPQDGVASTVRWLVFTTVLTLLAVGGTFGWTHWRDGTLPAWLHAPKTVTLPKRTWVLPETLFDAATNKASALTDKAPAWPDPYDYLNPKPVPQPQAEAPPEETTDESDATG